MQFDHAPGAGRRDAHAGILLVLEQRLAEDDAVAGGDQHRRLQAVDVESERGDALDGRRRIDARRRLSGERKIEPFRASVKARRPSFWLSPYRVHSPGLCVPLYAVTGRDRATLCPSRGHGLTRINALSVLLLLCPPARPSRRLARRVDRSRLAPRT